MQSLLSAIPMRQFKQFGAAAQGIAYFFNLFQVDPKPDAKQPYAPIPSVICTTCNDASSSVKCVHGNLCNQCHEKLCAREQNHHQVVNLLILCACPDRKCAQNPAEFTDAINNIKLPSHDQPNFSTSLASRWRAMKSWRRLAQLAVLQTFPAGIKPVQAPWRGRDQVRDKAVCVLQGKIACILEQPSTKHRRFQLACVRRRLRKVLWNSRLPTALPATPVSHKRRFQNVVSCGCAGRCGGRCGCKKAGRPCGELCHDRPGACGNMDAPGEHCWTSDDDSSHEPTTAELENWTWTP